MEKIFSLLVAFLLVGICQASMMVPQNFSAKKPPLPPKNKNGASSSSNPTAEDGVQFEMKIGLYSFYGPTVKMLKPFDGYNAGYYLLADLLEVHPALQMYSEFNGEFLIVKDDPRNIFGAEGEHANLRITKVKPLIEKIRQKLPDIGKTFRLWKEPLNEEHLFEPQMVHKYVILLYSFDDGKYKFQLRYSTQNKMVILQNLYTRETFIARKNDQNFIKMETIESFPNVQPMPFEGGPLLTSKLSKNKFFKRLALISAKIQNRLHFSKLRRLIKLDQRIFLYEFINFLADEKTRRIASDFAKWPVEVRDLEEFLAEEAKQELWLGFEEIVQQIP